MSTLGPATDHQAIQLVLNRYALALDERRFELLSETFTMDATFGRDPVVAGANAIAEYLRGLLAGCGSTQHLLGPASISFGPGRARAQIRSAVRAFHQGAGARSRLVYEMLGDYHDVALMTPSGWRIQQRWLDARVRLGPRSQVLGLD